MTKNLLSRSFFISVFSLTTMAAIALTGCNTVSLNAANSTANAAPDTNVNPVVNSQVELSPAVKAVVGNYVSEGYDKRAQGYDWVAVMISAKTISTNADHEGQVKTGETITIKVRARSDIKKPTCTFDGQATLMGQDTAHGIIFQTTINNSMAFFQFKEDALGDSKLIIDSQDKYALNHFCSGGGSIVGDYQKLTGDLELN